MCWNGGFLNFKVSKLVKSLLSLPLNKTGREFLTGKGGHGIRANLPAVKALLPG